MPFGVFMALFVVFPLFLVLYFAFTTVEGNLTFDNWTTVFADGQNWKVIGTTFIIAGITTVICLLIAYPIAYLLANKNIIRMLFSFISSYYRCGLTL